MFVVHVVLAGSGGLKRLMREVLHTVRQVYVGNSWISGRTHYA
jgi:hypothetical protein